MALVACPDCGNSMSDLAPACPNCGRPNTLIAPPVALVSVVAAPAVRTNHGTWLLAIPLLSTLLIWFYVGRMNLFQEPIVTLNWIEILTVGITAILAALEAKKVGMVSDRKRGTYGPIAWFFIVAGLWIVGYPAYMFKRRHYGLKNYLVGSLLVAFLFLGSALTMEHSIKDQIAQIQAAFNPP